MAIEYDLKRKEYLKNEKIQIIIRLTFTFLSIFIVYFFYQDNIEESQHVVKYLMEIPLFIIIYNFCYFFLIKYYPYAFQEERIYLTVLADIGAMVSMMYILEELSPYYAGVLLWFSIAYGMRYSKKIAYLAHITIVMSWIALMLTSDFWIEYRSFAVGWLLAYIVLPMYYFKLVEQLHANVDALHEVVYDSKIKAVHDHLTGIYNRTMFEEDFHTLLEDAQLKKEQFALFFIDLDGFKEINDTYGHDQGDKVLIETARRLMCVVEKTYRLGGDEFVCIVPFKTKEEVEKIAQEMMHYLRLPCQESDIKLSASVGISTFPKDATTAFDLKKQADQAMYQAKESGKNKYCFFDEMKTKKCESI